MEHWQELLELTNPSKWTPHAFYEMVRIFISKTESERTLRFFANYLLPRVLKDIKENRKLNYHLFRALQKGLYRPASWFRGVLMTFFNTPEVTIKHAQILAAVLMKTSIPNAHAAAVFYKCCELNYSGPQNVIMKTLIDKKFGLPAIVISRLVEWFGSFEGQVGQPMPVLWYQTLLGFVKVYGSKLNRSSQHRREK
jgi:essential nuclear protein 1